LRGALEKAVRTEQPGESSRKREARKAQLREKLGEGSKKKETKICLPDKDRQTRQVRD
jgi:hypothetical protein